MKKDINIALANKICDNILSNIKQKIFVDQYHDFVATLKAKSITNQYCLEGILIDCIKLESYITEVLNSKNQNKEELKKIMLNTAVSIIKELISREVFGNIISEEKPENTKNHDIEKTISTLKNLEKEVKEEKKKLHEETDALLKKIIPAGEF